jgi:SAM-dependent methyltransferase
MDEVNLEEYYRFYPTFPDNIERRLDSIYVNQLRRLVRFGLAREDSILDFGCGSGQFIRYLRQKGYAKAVGYDAYSDSFRDRSTLDQRFRCLLSQDVIEHVDDPLETLRQFDALTEPGGLILIGTPDADAIDLSRPDAFVHFLHAPYHRHILSARVLRSAAKKLGWRLEHFYSATYDNTLFPGRNQRFGLYYLRAYDDCLDLTTEPIRLNSWRLWTPLSLFFFLFGYFFDTHADVAFVFRKPKGP